MDLLLDTHAVLWFREDSSLLAPNSRKLIVDTNNSIFISIVTFWELAIKEGLGKMKLDYSLDTIHASCLQDNFKILPIEIIYLSIVKSLPYHHKDPFDRSIIATAISMNIPIITKDQHFHTYPIKTIWE